MTLADRHIGTREEWQAARDEVAKLEAEQAERNQEIKRKRRDSLVFSENFIEALAEDASNQPQLSLVVHEALTSCLEKLKQRDRDLYHRRYQSGMRIKQIAEQLDRPLDTLHSAFKRIRRILTQCIRNKIRDEEMPWLPRPS